MTDLDVLTALASGEIDEPTASALLDRPPSKRTLLKKGRPVKTGEQRETDEDARLTTAIAEWQSITTGARTLTAAQTARLRAIERSISREPRWLPLPLSRSPLALDDREVEPDEPGWHTPPPRVPERPASHLTPLVAMPRANMITPLNGSLPVCPHRLPHAQKATVLEGAAKQFGPLMEMVRAKRMTIDTLWRFV